MDALKLQNQDDEIKQLKIRLRNSDKNLNLSIKTITDLEEKITAKENHDKEQKQKITLLETKMKQIQVHYTFFGDEI